MMRHQDKPQESYAGGLAFNVTASVSSQGVWGGHTEEQYTLHVDLPFWCSRSVFNGKTGQMEENGVSGTTRVNYRGSLADLKQMRDRINAAIAEAEVRP